MVIYRITNTINNKQYIGKTSNLAKRLISHKHASKNKDTYFYRAIRKYGLENFKVEVIDKAISNEELSKLEIKYIKQYKTFAPNGYNSSLETNQGISISEEGRKKIGRTNQGKGHKKKTDSPIYIGVGKNLNCNTYFAAIKNNGKYVKKSFENELDAARAYDRMALFIYGPQAIINFESERNNYLSENLEEFYSCQRENKELYYYIVTFKGKKKLTFKLMEESRASGLRKQIAKFSSREEAENKLKQLKEKCDNNE